ncbi:DUF6708 domain-containing protein [Massilia sp. SR12]
MYSPEFIRPKCSKVNRLLQDDEKNAELQKKIPQHGFDEKVPHYQLSVIQLNSTFVELTDRDYPIRGVMTLMAIFAISLMSWLLIGTIFSTFAQWDSFELTQRDTATETIYFVAAIAIPIIAFSLYGFLREAFCYTHFPVRLNRKNRKIYVWSRSGVIFTVPWDKTYFFVRCYKKSGVHMWDIVGHRLSEDGQTVLDSFTLSSYTSSDAIDLQLHWEYFRRYMEVGPQQPHKMLSICLPIAKRRETWWEGFMRLNLLMHGSVIMQLMLLPFNLPASLGRLIAMRTSKIPRWPDWVEEECAVAKDDPYMRESGYEASRE